MKFHILLCGCLAIPKTSDGGGLAAPPLKLKEVEDASAALPPTTAEAETIPAIATTSSFLKPMESITSDIACQHGRVCSGPGSYLYSSASHPRTSSSRALVCGVEYHSFFVNPLAEGSHEEGAPIAYAGASVAEIEKGLNNPLAEEFQSSFTTPPESPCAPAKAAAAPPTNWDGANDSMAPAAPGTPTRGYVAAHSSRELLQSGACHQPWKAMQQSQPLPDLNELWEACSTPSTDATAPARPGEAAAPQQLGSDRVSARRAVDLAGALQPVEGAALEGHGGEGSCEVALGAGLKLAGGQEEAQLPATPATLPRPVVAASPAASTSLPQPQLRLSGGLPTLPELPTLQPLPTLTEQRPPAESPRSCDGQQQQQEQQEQQKPTQAETTETEGSAKVVAVEAAASPAAAAAAPHSELPFAPCTPPLPLREPGTVVSATTVSPADGLLGTALSDAGRQGPATASSTVSEASEMVTEQVAHASRPGSRVGHCYVPCVPVDGCGEPELEDQEPARRRLEACLQQEAAAAATTTAEAEAIVAERAMSLIVPVEQQLPGHDELPEVMQHVRLGCEAELPLQQLQQPQFALPPLPKCELPLADPSCVNGTGGDAGAPMPAPAVLVKPACGVSLGGAMLYPQAKVGGSFGGALERVRAPLSTPGGPSNTADPGCSISGLAMTRALIRQLGLLPGPRPGGETALPPPSSLAVAAAQQARLEALARLLPATGSAHVHCSEWGNSSGGDGGCAGGDWCSDHSVSTPSPFTYARHAAAAALRQTSESEVSSMAPPDASLAGPVFWGQQQQQQQQPKPQQQQGVSRHRLGQSYVHACEVAGAGGFRNAGAEGASDAHMAACACQDGNPVLLFEEGVGDGNGYGTTAGDGLFDDGGSTSSSSLCSSTSSSYLCEDGEEGFGSPRPVSRRQSWLEPQAWRPLRERYGRAVVAA